MISAQFHMLDGTVVDVDAAFEVDNGAPEELAISYSTSADRSGDELLNDSVHEGGSLYIFVTPTSQSLLDISRVQFFIDDPSMANGPVYEDWGQPYDLFGGNALDLDVLEPGIHTITAKLKIPGPDVVLQASFEVVAAGEPVEPEELTLKISGFADRSFAIDLDHLALPFGLSDAVCELTGVEGIDGNFIFVDPVYPTSDISKIEFYVDGEHVRTENNAPYDMAGGGNSYPLEALPDGERVVTAKIFYGNGHIESISAVIEAASEFSNAPPALATQPVPEPDLSEFVANKQAAIALGKAFFWDQQTGSDNIVACATCHFHAGGDNRVVNQIHPGPNGVFEVTNGPGEMTDFAKFPFHLLSDVNDRDSSVIRSLDDIHGSQGVLERDFLGVGIPPAPDLAGPAASPHRQVTGRNSPTVINAIFNIDSFWDGRAKFHFNGVTPFGDRDPDARIFRNSGSYGDTPSPERICIPYASLASQAVGPPLSSVEMSWAGRTFAELGRRLLNSPRPLADQLVHPDDSVFGPNGSYAYGTGIVRPDYMGLSKSYAELIQEAFVPSLWNGGNVHKDGSNWTHMEANFSLYWGLAIQLYEATLVSDDTRYDDWKNGDSEALTAQELEGLSLFLNQGKCINCHGGSTFAGATTLDFASESADPSQLGSGVERMPMAHGVALYDSGFYNIGVRPTAEDLGRGATDPWGNPLSWSRQETDMNRVDKILNSSGFTSFADPCQFEIDPCVPVMNGERVAVDGAFKTPNLRNISLTGPYMHNGGHGNLRDVVRFYARGADFRNANSDDLDPDVGGISKVAGNEARVDALIAFMEALTDERVRYERGPFDHPSLILPNGESLPAVGKDGSNEPLLPFQDHSISNEN